LLERVGRLQIQLDTADLLIDKAAAAVEKARRSPNETSVAEASYETAKARVVSDEAALAISSQLFELSGAQSTLQQYGLDRYWRDARTHTLHDAVRWKLPIIGNQVLNNIAPPRHGKI
jgi:alkylation response protein AidB-like acyl-CoA dehydrogenase